MKTTKKIGNYLIIAASLLIIAYGCKKDDDDTITDADGNIYTSVTIGSQVWMVENLKTTKYNDGTGITLITDNSEWRNTTAPAYCWYDNNISNKELFGAFYSWNAVNTEKLCPSGWHVPTLTELDELIEFLGGESVAGGKLKATGTIEGADGLWYQPNTDATNETGFSALPGGMRAADFYDFNYGGVWWLSTEYSPERAHAYYINYDSGAINLNDDGFAKYHGYSVRCIKD
ncbi:MAG: fibrobacter succinogenes major paralogous domain-containing protein [Bacteroidales bacterium]|nr:fibrobacter succinogenes major paralogous domain-containing protein [Bacteroidales bacterium]